MLIKILGNINIFFKWYNTFFYVAVHHHHHFEETLYIPWLKTKVKQFPPKIADDHKQLLALLDEVKNIEKEFIDSGNDRTKLLSVADSLRKRIQTLVGHMNEHSAEEETIIPPILKEHFSEKEEDLIVKQIIKHNGLTGNRMELPWIIAALERWGPDVLKDKFYPKLPGPVKHLYFKYWKNEYEMTNAGLIQSLKLDKQPPDPVQRCCCCCRWFV